MSVGFAKAVVQSTSGCSGRLVALSTMKLDRGHQERDFHRWMDSARSLGVQPYNLKLILFNKGLHASEQLVPVLPIHELMDAVWNQGPRQWKASFLHGGGSEQAQRFWDKTSHMKWSQAHAGVQALKSMGRLSRTLPLFFHQDGVEVFRGVEANMWSWASGLSHGNTVETKFPILFVWEHSMPNHRLRLAVNREVCNYINYCMEALERGSWPLKGFYGEELNSGARARMKGQPLCGGAWHALFAGWKGDGKARKVENNFSRGWDSTFICFECAAAAPFKNGPYELHYTHVGPNALWRETRIPHTMYMATDGSSPWALVRGWHLQLVHRDFAHVMLLGCCRDLAGSLLLELARHVLREEAGLLTLDDSLRWLYLAYKAWCKQRRLDPTPHVFSISTLGVKTDKYPKLSSEVKAAHTKQLMFFLAHAALKCDTGCEHDRVRTTCVCALARYFGVLDSSGMWLSEAQAEEAHKAGTTYLLCYVELAREALAMKQAMWKVRPKLHDCDEQLQRILEDKLNPLYVQCLFDEHMLGVYKATARGCHRASANLNLLKRFLVELQRRFEARAFAAQ